MSVVGTTIIKGIDKNEFPLKCKYDGNRHLHLTPYNWVGFQKRCMTIQSANSLTIGAPTFDHVVALLLRFLRLDQFSRVSAKADEGF